MGAAGPFIVCGRTLADGARRGISFGAGCFLERQRTGADGKQKVGNYIGLSRPARYLPTDHFQRPVPRGPPPRPPRRRPPVLRILYCKYSSRGACTGEFLLGQDVFLERQRTGADGLTKGRGLYRAQRPARYLPTDHFQRPVPRPRPDLPGADLHFTHTV